MLAQCKSSSIECSDSSDSFHTATDQSQDTDDEIKANDKMKTDDKLKADDKMKADDKTVPDDETKADNATKSDSIIGDDSKTSTEDKSVDKITVDDKTKSDNVTELDDKTKPDDKTKAGDKKEADNKTKADDDLEFTMASEGTDEPEFVQKLVGQSAEEGGVAKFECVVSGHPEPTVEWLHNREPISDGEVFQMSQDGNRHTLTIPYVYPEDGGIYIAEAINSAGTEMSCAQLSVTEAEHSDDEILPQTCSFYEDNGLTLADLTSSEEEEEEGDAEGNVEGEENLEEGGVFFKRPLRKITYAKEGRRATMECEVAGKSEVTWLKDNVEIPEASKHYNFHCEENGQVFLLEITKVTPGDKGDYTCVVRDGMREVKCSTTLIMKEQNHTAWDPVPAKFVTQLTDLTVKEGKSAIFQCEIAGNPTPEINWLCEGQFIEQSQNKRIWEENNLASLEILSAYKDDAGSYSCQVFNGLAQKQRTCAKLKVQDGKVRKFALKPPSFTDKSEDQRVQEGQNVEFTCHVHGNPKPKVTWHMNNEEVLETTYFHFDHVKDQYFLRIEEAFPEDEGEYVCRASNTVGKKEWRVRLMVDEHKSSVNHLDHSKSRAYSRPSFLTHLADHKATEGERVTFECKVTGMPEPEVIWFHRGKEVVEDGRNYLLEYNENGTSMLIIQRIRMDNAGKYVCVARSSLGVANSIAVLSVTERGPDDIIENLERRQSDASSCGDIPLPPQSCPNWEVLTQKSLLLSWDNSYCGTPENPASVTYIVQAKASSTTEWALVAADIIDTSLLVRHLNPDEEYTFRVRAESENGISEPSEETALIRPKEVVAERDLDLPAVPPNKPRLRRQSTFSAPPESEPTIITEEEDVYALKDGKCLLCCTIMGEPRPRVMWLRDDEVLDESEHIRWGYEEDGKCWLEIDGVTYHDIGEYECIAISTGGYASARLYVDVAEKPQFLVRFSDTMATVGEPLRLDCRLDGIPEPDIIWYKDDQPLQPGEGVDFLFEGEDTVSLLIDKCVPEDDGEYTLTAINMAGEETNTARVFVVEPEDNELIQRVTIKRDVTVQDEYEILAELGRGAYGVVKRCVAKETGEMCAAKFITVKSGRWTEIRREVKVMSVLDNKRLIKLIDAYETKRELVMIMDLVTGGELFERIITQDYITEKEAVYYIKQLVEGVHHMHEKNIIHLDLKPENILLVSPDSDEIKLIDFGLARIIRPGVNIICKFGTPEFVAPEVVRGQPVTTYSDVWSIGVIAYLLLSGVSPFMGDDDKETLRNVRKGDWEFDDPVWNQVSIEAQDFIQRLLRSDPDDRLPMEDCLDHPWLAFDEKEDEEVNALSTDKLKAFNSRRKWAKALTAVKSAMRLRRLTMFGGLSKKLLAKEPISEGAEESKKADDAINKKAEETLPVFESQLKDTLVLEDNDLELTCEVKGQPTPTVIWYHDDKKITERKNIEMKLDEAGKVSLKITEVKGDDAGVYKCTATNTQGSVSTSATVTMTDKPDIPCRPRVPLVSSTEAFVTWKLPPSARPVKITGYTLQFRKVGEKQWSLNSDTVQDFHMHVMALQPSMEYRFRIACCCPHGVGVFSRSSTPVKTLAVGSPPLSLEAIKNLIKRSRSQSLDRNCLASSSGESSSSSKPYDDSFEADDFADLTLKTSLPQKSYEFGVEIGRGRYSVIRRCRQYTTSQEHAAKLILITKTTLPKKINEYELLKEIRHPHIMQLYDVYQTQRYLVLITQRYFGSDILKHLVRNDEYSELQIMRYTKQIMGALDYLHSRNIAHLDLRHDNVLLESRRKESVRIIDFGSAVRLQPEDMETTQVLGADTLSEFMAPEFVLDKLNIVDCKTDMWALGVMLFTWISGTSPFLGRNRVKTMFNITRMKCNLSHLYKNSSVEATNLVRTLLKKEPSDRNSAAECLQDPWLRDTNEEDNGHIHFSSNRLRLYRDNYKLRVAALSTHETMTMRRYSSPLEARISGQIQTESTLRK